MSAKFLPSLQQNSHTRCSSSSFIITLSLIRRTVCARAQFSGCSSKTNAYSETGQMAVCCQNMTLGALSRHSTHSLLVGALFKKFRLLLNTPRRCVSYKHIYFTEQCPSEYKNSPISSGWMSRRLNYFRNILMYVNIIWILVKLEYIRAL